MSWCPGNGHYFLIVNNSGYTYINTIVHQFPDDRPYYKNYNLYIAKFDFILLKTNDSNSQSKFVIFMQIIYCYFCS